MLREFPERPIVGVGAIVLHEERILVVRRGTPPLEGEWSIPGGAQELGETLEEAVVREVREETALEVEPLTRVAVFDRMVHGENREVRFHYVLIDYLCRVKPGTQVEPRAGGDVLDVRWAMPVELEPLGVAEFTREVITKALQSK